MVKETNTSNKKIGWAWLVVAALLAGCESTTMSDGGAVSAPDMQGVDAATHLEPGALAENWPEEIRGPIQWLNPVGDITSWAETASLEAHVGGGTISMPYSKSRAWPAQDGVNANPWAIVNINGQWYAGTFEYLRAGQVAKPMGVLSKTGGFGDHFKVAPLSSWSPRSGERFGIMVSGLARGSLRNVKERSNISMVTWP